MFHFIIENQITVFPISASQVSRIPGMSQHHLAILTLLNSWVIGGIMELSPDSSKARMKKWSVLFWTWCHSDSRTDTGAPKWLKIDIPAMAPNNWHSSACILFILGSLCILPLKPLCVLAFHSFCILPSSCISHVSAPRKYG
jgi:hypothetical protein